MEADSNVRLVNIALSQYGQKEVVGRAHNPHILKYFEATDSSAVAIEDETSWCSAFINWCARESLLSRTKKLNARSWLGIGVHTNEPILGDVVIFWREAKTSWKGHVALYIRQDDTNIYVLGGNQSNEVNISKYPKSQLLGYRRLIEL